MQVGGKTVIAGQMYVEYRIPAKQTHPFPIIMIEGCCTSGAGFNGTVDGRDGWAQYFLSKGYAVYIMDQVGRGRSPYVEEVYGPRNPKAPMPRMLSGPSSVCAPRSDPTSTALPIVATSSKAICAAPSTVTHSATR